MNPSELIAHAGWTMLPLGLCSVLGLAVLIQKAVQFQREKVGDATLIVDLPHRKLAPLAAHMAEVDTPLARVLGVAAEATEHRPHTAEDETLRTASLELDRLENGLSLLAFVAQASPLFGLLGTVIGMVELFGAMETAGGDTDVALLARGIWQALLTTAAGLIVAIPALGGHTWLTRRLDRQRLLMETGAGQILDRRRARWDPR
jgi:biopolymer transport protein ExbB